MRLAILWQGKREMSAQPEKQSARILEIQGVADPFTLLKISQAFRETGIGQRLEIVIRGGCRPEELFRVIPEESYRLLLQERKADMNIRIVLEKLRDVSSAQEAGCQCGGPGNPHR